jgi:hypothetical protein
MSGWQCQSKIPSIIDQYFPETAMATTTTSIASNATPTKSSAITASYGYVVYYFKSINPKTETDSK